MTMHYRAFVRAGLAAAGASAVALAFTAVASAHVTIRPDVDTSGSFAKITVRVPNESDTAGTTQIRLEMPADTPMASVRVQPHPGWTAELTTEQFPEPVEVGDRTLEEAVTSVTWTADEGVRIGPDEFDEFAISVGPLPEPGTYLFPAIQTYDDGEVVAWDMEPTEGEEPERPAPELTVVPAEGAAEDDGGVHSVDDEPSASTDTSDTLARGVGIGGVVVGAAGLGIGAVALRRRHA